MAGGPARVYDLSAARPDGWFEEILKQSKEFETASRVIGRDTLALALVAGVRIVSLTANAGAQELTTVEFSLGQDPTIREIPLPEFREVIGRQLLVPLLSAPLPDDPPVEALQAHIGGRYLLEASLFKVRPLELRYELGLSEITLEFNEIRHVMPLADFRDVLDGRVRSELGVAGADDAAIDLTVVDQAEAANANGNWAATIAMLNPWLGPISMMLRTGEAEKLGEDAHGQLSVSLDLLGTAYAKLGELDAANEVLRLGVQWAGESGKAGKLFMSLGRASVASQKHGEAIGLLRRAISLGAAERDALPLLVKSLTDREQWLAALVCAERARALGEDTLELQAVRADLGTRLGDAWPRFQAWMSDPE